MRLIFDFQNNKQYNSRIRQRSLVFLIMIIVFTYFKELNLRKIYFYLNDKLSFILYNIFYIK